MSVDPLVAVVTPTTGNACVLRAIESVANRVIKHVPASHRYRQAESPANTKAAIRQCKVDVIELPYATGKDRFLGHRIIVHQPLSVRAIFLLPQRSVWFDTDHIAALLNVIGGDLHGPIRCERL